MLLKIRLKVLEKNLILDNQVKVRIIKTKMKIFINKKLHPYKNNHIIFLLEI